MYVASDDRDSRVKFRDRVPEALFDTVESYHVEKSTTISSEDARKSNLEVWAEFMIISRADCIVYSRSGFSELAVSLSRHIVTGARCAVQFNSCSHQEIQESMSSLVPLQVGWSTTTQLKRGFGKDRWTFALLVLIIASHFIVTSGARRKNKRP